SGGTRREGPGGRRHAFEAVSSRRSCRRLRELVGLLQRLSRLLLLLDFDGAATMRDGGALHLRVHDGLLKKWNAEWERASAQRAGGRRVHPIERVGAAGDDG